MDTAYWVFEFIKVLLSYLFLMFLWPKVVFGRYLKNKPKTYQFCFCAAVQILLINTVVLGLGTLRILNIWTVRIVFYGVFLFVLWRRAGFTAEKLERWGRSLRVSSFKSFWRRAGRLVQKGGKRLWAAIRPRFWEYLILAAVVAYGLLYFCWGRFQCPSYGYGDAYVHHSWIYGLIQGKVFSGGVYPEAMHCFIYCQYALCSVDVYSSILFLGSIQAAAFLLTVYCLLRELFGWRYTPSFMLVLFLILDLKSGGGLFGMARLQWTLPQDFGLVPQFLCVLFLVRYLKSSRRCVKKGRLSKYCLNSELFLFTAALAGSIATHFYAVIMAFFLCAAFALTALRRIFTKERFLPLVSAVLCGVFVAAAPMLIAFATGTPPENSLGWAMSVVDGTENSEGRGPQAVDPGEGNEPEENSGFFSTVKNKIVFFGDMMRRRGYAELYGSKWGDLHLVLAGFAVAVCVLVKLMSLWFPARTKAKRRLRQIRLEKTCFEGYLPLVLASVLFMLIYIAPYLGLPELILGARLCLTEHVLILAVAVIPLDLFFSVWAPFWKDSLLQVLSAACLAGLCVLVVATGNYHGYLYMELTRYNSEVMVMNGIARQFSPATYTIVSPTDGLYPNILNGWHEELLDFVQKTSGREEANYTLPSEYVFIFIEKKPLHYAQNHFFAGPSWLALEKYTYGATTSQEPEILASEISPEAAQKEIMQFRRPFEAYKNLESRTILESKAYAWCQRFSELYPQEMNVYYEDDDFVCYYFRQEQNSPYKLGLS